MNKALHALFALLLVAVMTACSSSRVITPEEKQRMKIKRGEMARLLVDQTELTDLEWSYEKKTPKQAMDIDDHDDEGDIEEIVEMSLRGLSVDEEGQFRPDDTLKRFEYALLFEDVLVRSQKNPDLATKFVGTQSPFDDLRTDWFFYNAIRTTEDAGLLGLKGKSQAYPKSAVTVAEAEMLILKINELLGDQ